MLRRHLTALLALVALIAAALLTGCGASAGAGGDGDPAAGAPRDALLYAEVALRPDGAARDGALDAAGKILHTDDPAGRLRQLVQQAFDHGDAKVDFARDIEPWLGDRAGLWVGAPRSAGADPAVGAIVDVRDTELARTKLEQLAKQDGHPLSRREVDGQEYEASADGSAVAFRDDQLLAGDEPDVRRMLTLPEDARLAGSDAYAKALDGLDGARLATVYLDMRRLLDVAAQQDPELQQQAGPLRSLLGPGALAPVGVSFSADGDRLAVEAVSRVSEDQARRFGGLVGASAAPLLKALPGGSWAAYAVPKAGESMQAVFSQAAGAFGGAAVADELRRSLGLDLQQDVFSWMGDLGVFVRGTTQSTFDGGLVVQIADEARAATAFGKFVGLARSRGGLDAQPIDVPGADAAFDLGVPNAPKPLVLARGKGRMVLAYGVDAAAQGLSPAQPLEDSSAYKQATDALGDGTDPMLLLSIPAIESIVEATGNADAEWRKAKPYVDAFSVIASGTKRDGDRLRSLFVAGLK